MHSQAAHHIQQRRRREYDAWHASRRCAGRHSARRGLRFRRQRQGARRPTGGASSGLPSTKRCKRFRMCASVGGRPPAPSTRTARPARHAGGPGEDLDHLAISARRLEHAPLQSPEGRRHLGEGRAVAQRPGLRWITARECRQSRPSRSCDHGAGEDAGVLGDELPSAAATMRRGRPDTDGPVGEGRRHAVAMALQVDQAGRRDAFVCSTKPSNRRRSCARSCASSRQTSATMPGREPCGISAHSSRIAPPANRSAAPRTGSSASAAKAGGARLGRSSRSPASPIRRPDCRTRPRTGSG